MGSTQNCHISRRYTMLAAIKRGVGSHCFTDWVNPLPSLGLGWYVYKTGILKISEESQRGWLASQLSLTDCVGWGKSLNLSEPPFS